MLNVGTKSTQAVRDFGLYFNRMEVCRKCAQRFFSSQKCSRYVAIANVDTISMELSSLHFKG